jgi:hypothetical protein
MCATGHTRTHTDVVRIFRPDGVFKSIRVEPTATAAEILTLALSKFQIGAGGLPGAVKDYRLVEALSDGGTGRQRLHACIGLCAQIRLMEGARQARASTHPRTLAWSAR